MKVMILCGGQGTRLLSAGVDLPKPMVPIGGRPILWHIMKGFSHWGYRDFVLCLGHRSDAIKQYFLNLSLMLYDVKIDLGSGQAPTALGDADERTWKITMAETGPDSMTAYRIKVAAAHLDSEDDVFAVTYGDGVCDVDFNKVVAFHRAHGKLATVTAVHPPGRFGELHIDPNRSVSEFNEKPQVEVGWISGGFFLFSRKFIDQLPDDPSVMLEEKPLWELSRSGQLMAYMHEGFWYCVDTPRDLQQMTRMWSAGNAPWSVWNRP
jgi:glucose-1-phosphate cytidylyltransferase